MHRLLLALSSLSLLTIPQVANAQQLNTTIDFDKKSAYDSKDFSVIPSPSATKPSINLSWALGKRFTLSAVGHDTLEAKSPFRAAPGEQLRATTHYSTALSYKLNNNFNVRFGKESVDPSNVIYGAKSEHMISLGIVGRF